MAERPAWTRKDKRSVQYIAYQLMLASTAKLSNRDRTRIIYANKGRLGALLLRYL